VVEPSVDLLESMRSVGYSAEAAIADIIDNSIDANARKIQIDLDVVNGDYIAVLDDGEGMDQVSAKEALRLAGTAHGHEGQRLGRFGLGLKTASLSQARCLTVVSVKNSVITALRWDIDHVKQTGSWTLLVLDAADINELPMVPELRKLENGTLIVWNKLDLLLGDAKNPGEFLAMSINEMTRHIGLTFHRYLSRRNNKLSITINKVEVKSIDPFLSENPKTQRTPREALIVGGHEVFFEAFTLPHQSGLSAEERSRIDLGEGMRDAQGFYIYRNERLISKGHWFGLASLSELTKLTRIQVDIPRNLDSLWQLDIKKSRIEPPASFKNHLRKMMEPILKKGKRVHSFRGRSESSAEVVHVWNKVKDRSGFRYEINVENSVVKATLMGLEPSQAESIVSLFGTIASQYPHLDVYNEIAGNAAPAIEVVDDALAIEKLKAMKDAGLFEAGPDSVYAILSMTEPFDNLDNLRDLIDQLWGD